MSKPTAEEYKIRFILYKEWQNKTTPENAIKNINNKLMDQNVIPSMKARANEIYKQFDKNTNESIIFFDSPLYISPTSKNDSDKKMSNSLAGSLVLLSDEKCFDMHKIITKNGRILFLPHHCRELSKTYITVYDLFLGTSRNNSVSFDVTQSRFTMLGEHLLALESISNSRVGTIHKFHIFKINYSQLGIEKIKTVNFKKNLSFPEILPDTLNKHKFIIWDYNHAVTGQFLNEKKIVMGKVKGFAGFASNKMRLMGNKLEGVSYHGNDVLSSMKFRETDFETMEKKEINVPINLESDIELATQNSSGISVNYWSSDKFYMIFKTTSEQHYLLAFDLKSLKWFDVKILVNSPMGIFIDENEVMTLKVGKSGGIKAFYRIGLRKPDALLNLTRLAALRESNLYGNEKYIKAVRRIGI